MLRLGTSNIFATKSLQDCSSVNPFDHFGASNGWFSVVIRSTSTKYYVSCADFSLEWQQNTNFSWNGDLNSGHKSRILEHLAQKQYFAAQWAVCVVPCNFQHVTGLRTYFNDTQTKSESKYFFLLKWPISRQTSGFCQNAPIFAERKSNAAVQQTSEVPTGTETESEISWEQKELPEKSDLTPGSNVEWLVAIELSTQCRVTTPNVLPDDLLAMKRAGNATPEMHVNRAPTSCVLGGSIQWLNLKRATWQSLLRSGNVISTRPTTFCKRGECVTSTPTCCFAPDSGTRNFCQLPEIPELLTANIVMNEETLSTPNYFVEYSLTNALTLANNSHIPVSKVPVINSLLLPNLSEETSQSHFAERCLHQFIQKDPQFFEAELPGGVNKARPAGHRRGCPPRLVTKNFLPAGSDRPKGHRRGRPPNTYPTFETKSVNYCNFRWCKLVNFEAVSTSVKTYHCV